MAIYKTRQSAESYGHSVGILLLDSHVPYVPGDVANASTYRYPVIYELVSGLKADICLNGAPEFVAPVIAAAKSLADQGVRGISSDCGFMLQYQNSVADAVDVPVALSSLLQLPLIERTLKPDATVGIITADSTNLTTDFLQRAGITPRNPVCIRGMQNEAEFSSSIFEAKGTMDTDLMTRETVSVAESMCRADPKLGAILLECSLLPPYAGAVQQAVGLPVFDFISLIDFMRSGLQPRRAHGWL